MPQLNIQTVSQMIAQVATRHMEKPGEAQYSAAYIGTLKALLILLERRIGDAPEMAEAPALARQALNSMQAKDA